MAAPHHVQRPQVQEVGHLVVVKTSDVRRRRDVAAEPRQVDADHHSRAIGHRDLLAGEQSEVLLHHAGEQGSDVKKNNN